ncbi:MAG: PAS domain S-box protein [Promethearchaeati archaeon]
MNGERELLESLESLVFVIDSDNKFTSCYGGKRTPLYAKPENFIGQPVSSIIPQHVLDKFQDTAALVRKTEHRHGFDYSLVIDGEDRWFHIDIELHNDGQSLIGIVNEITATRRIQNAIAERELMYRVLFESANDAIFIMNRATFLKCNDRTLEMFGCQRDEILGKHPFDLSPEYQPNGDPSEDLALERINEALQGNPQVFRWVHKRCDSKLFHAQVSLNRIQLDGETLIQAIVRDVTDQVNMEKELRESQKKYRTLFEEAPVAIMIVGSEGDILAANDAASVLLGYDTTHLQSMNFKTLYSSHNNSKGLVHTLVSNGKLTRHEATLKHRTGRNLSILLDSEPVQIAHEWVNFVTIRDITQQKRISENLKTAAETANLYLDIMSHDIRNNLQAIMTAAEIIRNEAQNVEVERPIETIIEAVGNSNAMIHSLHDTKGLLSVELQRMNLIDVIDHCIADLRTEHPRIAIQKDYETGEAPVQADRYAYDLFHNLIENGIIHNDNPKPSVWIQLVQVDRGYLVMVADNGPGFSRSRKQALFDPKRRFGGVGLHQVKYLVERYDGKIDVRNRVENKNDEGTSFVIWLPQAST